jgi:hypothetical protein
MTAKLTILFITLAVFCITSCSIQKRQHLPGYHIEWHRNDHSAHFISEQRKSKYTLEEPNSLLTNSNNTNHILDNEQTSHNKPDSLQIQTTESTAKKDHHQTRIVIPSATIPIIDKKKSNASILANIMRRLTWLHSIQIGDTGNEVFKKRKKKNGWLNKVKEPGKVGGILTLIALAMIIISSVIFAVTYETLTIQATLSATLIFLLFLYLCALIGTVGFILGIKSFRKKEKKHRGLRITAIVLGTFFAGMALSFTAAFVMVLITILVDKLKG